MFDSSIPKSHEFNTSVGSNSLDFSSSAIANLAADSLLAPTAARELIFSGKLESSFYLNEYLQNVATNISNISGSLATDLFLFGQQENLTRMLTSSSINVVGEPQKTQVKNTPHSLRSLLR